LFENGYYENIAVCNEYKDARFEVFTAMKIQVAVFWTVTSCSDETYRGRISLRNKQQYRPRITIVTRF